MYARRSAHDLCHGANEIVLPRASQSDAHMYKELNVSVGGFQEAWGSSTNYQSHCLALIV
jgi:hypothetical protein